MRKSMLILVVLCLALPSLSRAEDAQVRGSLTLRGEGYFHEGCPDCDREGALGKFELELSAKKDNYEIFLSPVARADTFGFAQGAFQDWGNEDRHESAISIREGYVLLKPWERLEVGAGQKIFRWGVGEEINPTNFNPRRYLNLVEPEDLGLLSGWVTLRPTKSTLLEAVVSKSGASQAPWKGDYWWFPPDLKGVRIEEADIPDKPQFAARAGWENGRWKGYLSYFRGYHNLPAFATSFPIPGVLEPEYFKTQVVGANFAADLGWFGLKGEGAYKQQKGGQDNYLQWLVGADKFITWERGSLYVLLQYVRENVVDEGPNPYQALDLSRLLKNSVTLKAEMEQGSWVLGLRGAYEVEKGGIYLQPKVSRWLGEKWKVSIGCDILSGPKDGSVFGQYDRNDRAFLEIGVSF